MARPSRTPWPTIRVFAVLLTAAALAACFEEPVRERVRLFLAADGRVVLTVSQEIAADESARGNRRLLERLDQARSGIESGVDRWSRHFADLRCLADRSLSERSDGSIRRVRRSAVLAGFGEIAPVLAREGLAGELHDDGRELELVLFPAGGTRATWEQRQEVEDVIARWSETVAVYLEAAGGLYAYLDLNPDRAVACFSHVFDRHDESSGPLTKHESTLCRAAKKGSEAVASVLLVDGGRAYSPNELASLALDPFPSELAVAVDGAVVEAEGLVGTGTELERPRVDLWTALAGIEGRWLEPDIALAMVAETLADGAADPLPERFARASRRWASSPPDPREVENEIRKGLSPPTVHRLRWRPRSVGDEDEDALGLLRRATDPMSRSGR